MNIQIARIIKQTRVEGPGIRFCIYVQGCDIYCPGCSNTDMWDFNKGVCYELSEIQTMIKKESAHIDGITFLGGEPTCQAEAVLVLLQYAHSLGLTTVLFSGRTFEDLSNSQDETIKQILDNTDLLIAGPFLKEEFDLSRPWVGSRNQTYHFLSERLSKFKEQLPQIKNAFEVSLTAEGKIQVNGMGDITKIRRILECRKENK